MRSTCASWTSNAAYLRNWALLLGSRIWAEKARRRRGQPHGDATPEERFFFAAWRESIRIEGGAEIGRAATLSNRRCSCRRSAKPTESLRLAHRELPPYSCPECCAAVNTRLMLFSSIVSRMAWPFWVLVPTPGSFFPVTNFAGNVTTFFPFCVSVA